MVKYTPQSGIYIILNTKNGKVYIGQTQNFRVRLKHHKRMLRGDYHPNRYLQAAWNKYGEKTFKFQKLEYCPIEQLDEREQHYLDVYMVQDLCYNLSRNAKAPMRGLKFSEEHKRKIGEANRNVSEETRHKKSEAQKGKKHNEESRHKMSEAAKRRGISEETRQKMNEAHKRRREQNRQKKH